MGNSVEAATAFGKAIEQDAAIFTRHSTWTQILIYSDPSFPQISERWFPDFCQIWDSVADLARGDSQRPSRKHNISGLRAERAALSFALHRLALRRRRRCLAAFWLLRTLLSSPLRYARRFGLRDIIRTYRGLHPPFNLVRFVKTALGPTLTRLIVTIVRKVRPKRR